MNANSAPNEPRDPDNFNLHTRLIVLETRFDTILPTLATKHDLSMLELRINDEFRAIRALISEMDVKIERTRTELEQSISRLERWFAGLLVSVLLGFIHVSYQLATRLPAPAPIAPAVKSAPEHPPSLADRK